MIRIEFIFSRFKSIPLGASGERFRKQTKEGKSLFALRGLVSCDANKTSSELPLALCKYSVYALTHFFFFYNFRYTQGFEMNCFLLPIFVASFFMIGTAYGIPLTPEDAELNSELISYYFF